MDHDEVAGVVKAVLVGRTHEFAKLLREFGLPVRSFVHARIHHAADAEDVAQEVFISAFRSLADFDPGRSFGAWLTGIARHRILEHLRARGRRLGAMERFQAEVVQRVERDLAACQATQGSERIERLLDCIDRLPERLRKVVRGHLAETRARQLADEMATTPGAIYTMQWRANQLLRECMEATS